MRVEAPGLARRLKRTPLYSIHRRLGAKMVEFAGWEMPVRYRGVIEEHLAVRKRAGLFDVSHMGEIEVRGARALDSCQRLTANDLSKLRVGQAQYNLLLNEQGGVVDDCVVYRLGADHLFFCVNAANADKDFRWIRERAGGDAEAENTSSRYVQLALQGPRAEEVLRGLTSLRLEEIKPFYFSFGEVASVRCLVARTGYTGEDGFELFCDADQGAQLWLSLLEAGRGLGLEPCGLGARDTLRLERALPLYGHELDEETTPLEAGLEWVVKFAKGPFLGREALLKQREEGISRKLVGIEMVEPGIARGGYRIFKAGNPIGQVTSGTKSPTLGKAIALAYVPATEGIAGNRLEVEIRGRRVQARVVSLPFYRRNQTNRQGGK